MKALIFAAGLGTRLKPLTDTMPKALVPIDGKPLLEHVILKLKAAGFNQIIINVHHFPDQIIDFLKSKNNFDLRIEVSDERDKLLDTGGGVKKAKWFFDDGKPFLVHNVDILSNIDLQSLYQQHLETSPLATLVVSERDTFRYFLFDKEARLKGWINEKTGEVRPDHLANTQLFNKLAFSGIQVLSPEVFKLMDHFPDYFSIVDFYLQNAAQQQIKAYVPQALKMIDVGKLNVLTDAEQFVRNDQNSK
ncbi:MAG: nucleotidyltransferase family protein [Paludibacter sp.]|nr:nucleotidyltransferase family protein [Paludibacter sp.]